jgi:predicted phage baseplate assembly protein
MSLPAPNLDDRTFQQLVDEAKRFVQRRCPSWTDHNVSDPGVTLIETFAWMTDLLLYRLNRVPERNYMKFLNLIGVELFPPTAAHTEVSFRLSSHQEDEVRIAEGTAVSTRRTPTEQSVGFTTVEELTIVPATSEVVGSMIDGTELRDHTPRMGLGPPFPCFDDRPKVDDALYVGFDRPAPSSIVLLQITCEVGGHGIDPRDPPVWWEAWNGDGNRWERCDVERDTTGGLNVTGAVELHLPHGHASSSVAGRTAAWLRCRVVEVVGEQQPYRSSPRIVSVSGATVGGDVEAIHGERVDNEVLGTSEGVAGQTFVVQAPPVVLGSDPLVLEVRPPPLRDERNGDSPALPPTVAESGAAEDVPWEEWTRVADFADSRSGSRHFRLDPTTGEVSLGPAVRLEDGSLHQYGAVPPKGSVLRLRAYRTGGGQQGNVAARAISTLRSSIPYVATVYNRRLAAGGVDGESVSEARIRGPIAIRTRNRAVTTEDYEELVRQAAPEIRRVRCVLQEDGPDAGALRVLVIPAAREEEGRIRLEHLILAGASGNRIRDYLDERRVVGTRVEVEPPSYLGVKVAARVKARPDADHRRLEREALRALYSYFNPLSGGPEGDGWPFGRPVQVGEVHGVLQGVRGVDHVEEAVLVAANPVTRELFEPRDRIDLQPTNLVFSFEHQVEVES